MPLKLFGPKPTPEDSTTEAEAAPQGGPTMTTATVRDLLYVTYAVPPERLTEHIPTGLALDRLPNADGDVTAFVQVVCGLYQSARWSPLPEFVGDAFYQVTYRVLIRRTIPATTEGAKPEKRAGVWALHSFANTSERHLSQRLVDRAADFARISLFIDGDPARDLYDYYRIRSEADTGQTYLTVKFDKDAPSVPAPFGNEADMTAFLTQRTEQFFRLSVPGPAVGLLPIRQGALSPIRGELVSARVTPLIDTGILTNDEAQKPLAVLLQPSLTVHAFPPRPIKLSVSGG